MTTTTLVDSPECSASDLELTTVTDKLSYRVGETVHIQNRYKNVSQHTCWPDTCGEISVQDSEGKTVWKPMIVCASVRSYLVPGEAREEVTDWDQVTCPTAQEGGGSTCPRAATGSYTAVKSWTAYDSMRSAPFSLE
jgi:hypothetical protein